VQNTRTEKSHLAESDMLIYSITELLRLRTQISDTSVSVGPLRPEETLTGPSKRVTRAVNAVERRLQQLLSSEPKRTRTEFIVVRRYDVTLSNREFKANYLATHKSFQGLKTLPRSELRVAKHGARVRFLEEHFSKIREIQRDLQHLRHMLLPGASTRGLRSIELKFNLRRGDSRRKSPAYKREARRRRRLKRVQSREPVTVQGPSGPVKYIPPGMRPRKRKRVTLVLPNGAVSGRLNHLGDSVYLNVNGGPTVPYSSVSDAVPLIGENGQEVTPGQWYFRRKYGTWAKLN